MIGPDGCSKDRTSAGASGAALRRSFPLPFPADLAKNGRRHSLIRALEWRLADQGEKERYANRETAPMFPVVSFSSTSCRLEQLDRVAVGVLDLERSVHEWRSMTFIGDLSPRLAFR
jgi:hypothetical protein